MRYNLEQFHNKILAKINDVYNVFKNHFGEEFVDLQNTFISLDTYNTYLQSCNLPSFSSNNPEIELSEEDINTLRAAISEDLSVDVHNYPFILIYWPQVTVTNEFDESVDIQDLYASVYVTFSGRMPMTSHGFYLNRARYSECQMKVGYMHSHTPRVHFDNPNVNLDRFVLPCLGRGPINNTINSLKNENSNNVFWMLFCRELSVYVTVESVAGVPYIKLNDITSRGYKKDYTYRLGYDYTLNSGISISDFLNVEDFKEFIKYYMQKGHLGFNYIAGKFVPSLPYKKFIIDISKCCLDFFRETKKALSPRIRYFLQRKIINNQIYRPDDYSMSSFHFDKEALERKRICTFKGRDIYLKIDLSNDEEEIEDIYLLKPQLADWIIGEILYIINYRFNNENNGNKNTEQASTACKNVKFI